MNDKSTVALLTDFGESDGFVAAMKGVVKSIAPQAEIIDIAHDVEPQNVERAAILLADVFKYFPDGTIFCTVVDPGVGTERKAIAIESGGKFYVGPDNGLFSYCIDSERSRAFELTNPKYRLENPSSTFHGRDIFAPAAAHISRGIALGRFGRQIETNSLVELPPIEPAFEKDKILGRVLYADRFGNLVTSIKSEHLQGRIVERIEIGDYSIGRINNAFGEVEIGELLAYFGSSGRLEIAVRNGSALEKIDLGFLLKKNRAIVSFKL